MTALGHRFKAPRLTSTTINQEAPMTTPRPYTNDWAVSDIPPRRDCGPRVLSDLANLPANLRQACQGLESAVAAISGSTLTPQGRENILSARSAIDNLCELPDGFDGRIRGVLHYRKEIARLAQAEADRAIAASELPEVELTQEQRTALARQAAGR